MCRYTSDKTVKEIFDELQSEIYIERKRETPSEIYDLMYTIDADLNNHLRVKRMLDYSTLCLEFTLSFELGIHRDIHQIEDAFYSLKDSLY